MIVGRTLKREAENRSSLADYCRTFLRFLSNPLPFSFSITKNRTKTPIGLFNKNRRLTVNFCMRFLPYVIHRVE